jgi:hypothetical protein
MLQDRQLKVFVSLLIVLGLCGFLVSFALSFQSLGLGQGLEIGDAELERILYGEGKNPFSVSVETTHRRMASDYAAISVSFVLIAVIGAFQLLSRRFKQVAFPLLSIASAAVGANFLRVLIRDKTSVEDFFYQAPRNEFVKLTIAYDWFLLVLVAATVVCSLFLIVVIATRTTR